MSSGTLGTFAGVFTPSILTILGIILFLRMGYVVGNAGLARALIILALANGISVLTTFSLSAIATNLKVKGGGDYYLISRTLGLEFGGAIGIVLFLAQSVSIAFYCIGFGEVLARMLPLQGGNYTQIIAAVAVGFLFIFAWLGTDWATRFQYVVMTILVAALLSFFIGGIAKWNNELLVQNWTAPETGLGFWIIFAIFFPAVTGFTQGVSMSGDLKDAGKSLPQGTFIAVGLSIGVYFLAAIVFAAALPAETLMSEYESMKRISAVEFLIRAGVIAATLSSAMASFLGAPRILQSLSADRIFPFLLPFAKGTGPTQNPRRGVLLSAGIAFATIGLGKLNIIAPVVSMFFLISYGLLNYATFFEARAGSPSFRPRFRWYDKRFSLAGALACLTVMLAIDVTAGVVALAILFGIYQYLKRTSGPARWADSRRSYHLQRIRANLLAAAEEPEHPRDWRPQLLLFSVDAHRRKRLLQFAEWLEGDTGFTTVVRILEGEGAKMLKLREEAEKELRQDIADSNSEAFPLVIVAPSLIQGIQTLVQGYGIGPLKANTILLNWFEHQPTTNLGIRQILYGRRIKTAFRLGCNIIVLDANDKEWTHLESSIPAGERRIDVWWGDDASSHLMLLLAYLMTRSQNWADATIRVLTQKFEHTPEQALENLRLKLEDFRIEAQPKVISDVSAETIAAYSMDAALVFLPFRLKGNQPFDPFDRPIEEILNSLPITALVLAAEDIILEAEPEAGKAAERATALDALADAEKRVRATEKDAAAAKETELGLKEKLDQMDSETDKGGVKESKRKELKTSLEEAENHAEKAARRAAKARAKAETASRVVEDLGIKPSKSDAEAEEATDSEKE
ncbi:MAG: amino acid permease [Desulfobacterales bacterium]|nr:amino acid permease [Desulfobacterales bacterium]